MQSTYEKLLRVVCFKLCQLQLILEENISPINFAETMGNIITFSAEKIRAGGAPYCDHRHEYLVIRTDLWHIELRKCA